MGDYREEAVQMLFWLEADSFDRQAVNHRLALKTSGDERWLEMEEVEIN